MYISETLSICFTMTQSYMQLSAISDDKGLSWAWSVAYTFHLYRYLVQSGCIKPLCNLLETSEARIIKIAMEALENILKVWVPGLALELLILLEPSEFESVQGKFAKHLFSPVNIGMNLEVQYITFPWSLHYHSIISPASHFPKNHIWAAMLVIFQNHTHASLDNAVCQVCAHSDISGETPLKG